MRFAVLASLLLVVPAVSRAHGQAAVPQPRPVKRAAATRVPAGAITVDGGLGDEAWRLAEPVTDFVMKEPTEGGAPTDDMEVRFAYDDRAFYIGARMFSRNSRAIQAPLGRRDNVAQAEHILVALDTFQDRRTSVVFGVTASGVRLDRFHATDTEETFDLTFDLVWDAAARQDADGWTAEIWIPFAQLRFNPESDLTWGLNVQRFRPTLNEQDTWVLIPRTVRAWSSWFGDLRGIADVPSSRRLELSPYVAAASTLYPEASVGNPFTDGANVTGRVGADVKMGLGPNLTLEATINPDFGQVEADPAEVNLTAFETRFPERRPFFLEGAPLFNIGHPNFYYSRRIGARPVGPAIGDYVDYPTDTTILTAAKLTGRLPSKTSIGFLSAVTAEESAEVASALRPGFAARSTSRRAPTTGWDACCRSSARWAPPPACSRASCTATSTTATPLADLLAKNALALAGNTLLRFRGGEYELRVAGGGSLVSGTAAAIERVQRSSAHFAQRPDRTYSPLDPTLTSLGGWTAQVNFDRVERAALAVGRQHQDRLGELRDQRPGDPERRRRLVEQRQHPLPRDAAGRVFRATTSSGSTRTPTPRLRRLVQAGYAAVDGDRDLGQLLDHVDGRAPRPGADQRVADARRPADGARSGRDDRRQPRQPRRRADALDGGADRSRNDDGFRERPHQQAVVGASGAAVAAVGRAVLRAHHRAAAVRRRRWPAAGPRPTGRATSSRSSTAAPSPPPFRLGLTVKPDMNLDVYAEPFAASGRYYDYGELLAPSSRERLLLWHGGHVARRQPRRQPDGDRRRLDLHAAQPRLQHAVVPQQRRAALGMASGQHALRRVAAEPRRHRSRGDYVGAGDMFRSLTRAPARTTS